MVSCPIIVLARFARMEVIAFTPADLPPENWTSENVSSPGI